MNRTRTTRRPWLWLTVAAVSIGMLAAAPVAPARTAPSSNRPHHPISCGKAKQNLKVSQGDLASAKTAEKKAKKKYKKAKKKYAKGKHGSHAKALKRKLKKAKAKYKQAKTNRKNSQTRVANDQQTVDDSCGSSG
jgi:hypothetical protein